MEVGNLRKAFASLIMSNAFLFASHHIEGFLANVGWYLAFTMFVYTCSFILVKEMMAYHIIIPPSVAYIYAIPFTVGISITTFAFAVILLAAMIVSAVWMKEPLPA